MQDVVFLKIHVFLKIRVDIEALMGNLYGNLEANTSQHYSHTPSTRAGIILCGL